MTKVTKPTIDAPGGPLPLFFGRSDDFPNPSVVLVHELWGLNGNIQDIALRLAEETFYTVVVPDLWRGVQVEDTEAGKELLAAKDMDEVLGDLQATVGWLATQRAPTIAAMGFCWGGRVVWRLAQEDERLNAAVPFYGRVDLDDPKPIHCPVVAHFGGADAGTPPEYIEQVRAYLAQQPYAHDVFVYEDAPHAFFNDTRESYRADAAELAWRRTLEFFANELGQ